MNDIYEPRTYFILHAVWTYISRIQMIFWSSAILVKESWSSTYFFENLIILIFILEVA